MTARTCETCVHADMVELYVFGKVVRAVVCGCDFDGVTVPCNESGVCGRWAAREGEEVEDEAR